MKIANPKVMTMQEVCNVVSESFGVYAQQFDSTSIMVTYMYYDVNGNRNEFNEETDVFSGSPEDIFNQINQWVHDPEMWINIGRTMVCDPNITPSDVQQYIDDLYRTGLKSVEINFHDCNFVEIAIGYQHFGKISGKVCSYAKVIGNVGNIEDTVEYIKNWFMNRPGVVKCSHKEVW